MSKSSFLIIFAFFALALTSAQAAPKVPCGTAEGLTIDQRIADCNEQPVVLSTGQKFALVSRQIDRNDHSSEYFRDEYSGLVWGPEATQLMAWEEALLYCPQLKDLGLQWRLPTRSEFLKAGNKDNDDTNFDYEYFNDPNEKKDPDNYTSEKYFPYNKVLLEVSGMHDPFKWYWSSTHSIGFTSWVFGAGEGRTYRAGRLNKGTVRCVGRL